MRLKLKYITNLATTAALNAVENKMPKVIESFRQSNLIIVIQSKKTDYNMKLVKLKRKLLIMIMINILLLQNLINQQDLFLEDQPKQVQQIEMIFLVS